MPQALHQWPVYQATGFSACTCLGCPSAGGQSTTGSARKELRSCMFECGASQVALMKPPLSRNRRRRKRRFIGRRRRSYCIVAHQGLTHRSSGQSKGCAFCLPLTSNVRRANALVSNISSLCHRQFSSCRHRRRGSLALRALAVRRMPSRYAASPRSVGALARVKARCLGTSGASNPSFERTAYGSRSIPSLGGANARQ